MPESHSFPPRTMSLGNKGPSSPPAPRRSFSPARSVSPPQSATDWGDEIPVVNIAPGSLGGSEDIVPTGFDEAVLRSLCELDVRISLLFIRLIVNDKDALDRAVRCPSPSRQNKTIDGLMS